MDISSNNHLLPGDPRLVDYIVGELKFQGIFDQLRKECIADVDTKPAYQNLRQRVEGNVSSFLKSQKWKPDLNKNHVREMLRKNIQESGYLEIGVERIVDQVVNPKINTVFYSQVEDVVYKYLGIERPIRNQIKSTIAPLSVNTLDLLPTDLDPVSPASDKSPNKSISKSEQEIEENDKLDDSFKIDEEESPPFEPIEDTKDFLLQEEISMDSQLSGISGLTSHDSNHSGTIEEKFAATAPDVANPDSQLSKVSSNSRLSIVTSDGKTTPLEINNESKISETANNLSEKLKIDENSSSKQSSIEMNQESQADSEQSIDMKDEKVHITIEEHFKNDEDDQIIDMKNKDEIIENEQNSVVESKQESENIMIENEFVQQEPMDTVDFQNLDVKNEERSDTELKELDRKRDKYNKEHESKRSRYSDSKDRGTDRDKKSKGRHSSSSSSSRDKDRSKEKNKDSRKEKDIKDSTKHDKDKNVKVEKDRSYRDDREKNTKDDKVSKDDREDRNKRDEKTKSDDKSKSKDNDKAKEKEHRPKDDRSRDRSEKSKDDKCKSDKYRDKENSDSKKRDEKHSNSSSKHRSRDRSSSSKTESSRRDSSGKEDSKDKLKSSKDYKNSSELKVKDSKVNKDSRDSSKDSKSKSGDESKSLKESSKYKETREEKDRDINGDREKNKDKDALNGDVKNKYNKDHLKDVKYKNKDRERTKSESKHSSSHKSSSGRDKKDKSHKDMKKESSNKKDIKDDHFSSKDKNTDGRRSADRDSNNGGSGSLSQGSNSSERNEISKQKNKESSASDIGSQQSGNSEQLDHEVALDAFQSKLNEADSIFTPAKVVKLDVIGKEISIMPCSSVPLKKRIHTMDTFNTGTENTINNLQDDGQAQIKIKKPRFASNIFEARKLIKIRKRMEKMERKRQKQVQCENQVYESESCEGGANSTNKMDITDMKETEKENFDEKQQDKLDIKETIEMDSKSVITLNKENMKKEKLKADSLSPKENCKIEIEIETPVKTPPAISVISKESWDAIEAKLNQSTMLNIDYASYGYDSEASPTKSPSKIIYSDDEEDCLYFNPKTSPSTERYLKRIAALQKLGPNISVSEMFSEVNKNSKIDTNLHEEQKAIRRSRKPNMKYCSEEYASEDTLDNEKIDEEKIVYNEYANKGKTGKNTVKKKSSDIDLDDENDLTVDNNNIKLKNEKTEIVKDSDHAEVKTDSSSLNENATVIDNLEIIPVRTTKGRKSKKLSTAIPANHITSNVDNFNLPPSPESDISVSSIETKSVVSRKRNLDVDTSASKRNENSKINNRTPKTVTQRYSSDDLYKPRPLFGSTRRSRALDKSGADVPVLKRRK